MPSGAKKRKAAKKRNEVHPNNDPNPSPASASASAQGGGDVKNQDDRQSDVGEASSTASQDPNHHDLLTEGEEEKIENRENVSILPSDDLKNEGDNKHGIVAKGIDVAVERESKIDDAFDKKNGGFEHDETERKAYDGGSSRSSSSRSSSDDESNGIKKSRAPLPNKVSSVNDPGVSLEEQVGVSETCKGAASQPDEANPKACVAEETDDHPILSYNPPIASLDDEADAEKDSGVTEPLLGPPPRPVETTSWKGCCGLFELFTGSGR